MDGVRVVGERGVDVAITLADCARAIDVDRSANLVDDRLDADAVTDEAAVGGLERLGHERFAWYHALIPANILTHAGHVR